ncbi:MAG: mechanosensitive ion channel [Deltaproteobacteria bacterium]|jgi:small-conductance mechanosensitive channel|nr:mechanosensitive ion channel [Deltaproteobacteria bacterium]
MMAQNLTAEGGSLSHATPNVAYDAETDIADDAAELTPSEITEAELILAANEEFSGALASDSSFGSMENNDVATEQEQEDEELDQPKPISQEEIQAVLNEETPELDVKPVFDETTSRFRTLMNRIKRNIEANVRLQTDDKTVINQEYIETLEKYTEQFHRRRNEFPSYSGHPLWQEATYFFQRELGNKTGELIKPVSVLRLSIKNNLDEADGLFKEIDENRINLVKNAKISISNLENVFDKLLKFEEDIINADDKAQSLLVEMNQSRDDMLQGISSAWATYYLTSLTIWNRTQWKRTEGENKFLGFISKWYQEIQDERIGYILLPLKPEDIESVEFRFVACLAILIFIGYLLSIYINKTKKDEIIRLAKAIKGPWKLLITGFSLLIASINLSYGGYFLAIKLSAILIIIWGLGSLSWRLREAVFSAGAEKYNDSPLSRFYPPAAFGMFFLFTDFSAELLNLFWLAIMIAYLFWLKIFNKDRPEPEVLDENGQPIETKGHSLLIKRIAFVSSFWFAFASTVVTISGYTRLAILIFMSLYTLVNIVIMASALVEIVKIVSSHFFDKTTSPMKNSISLSMTIPLAIVLSLGCAIPWIWATPGLDHIIRTIINKDYKILGASFEVSRILLVVFLFILFRSLRALGDTFLKRMPSKYQGLSSYVNPLKYVLAYIIWIIYGVISLALLGFNFTSLAIVAGGLSVGFGLGLQAICGNFLSGVFLMFDKNIELGDLVEVDNILGTVKSINMRATEIETLEKAVVYIPNYNIVSGKYINWTRNHMHARRKINVFTPYSIDIDKVIKILLAAAENSPDVLGGQSDPIEAVNNSSGVSEQSPTSNNTSGASEPSQTDNDSNGESDPIWAVLEEFAEESLVFALYITIKDVHRSINAMSALRKDIKDRFENADLPMHSPFLEIVCPKPGEEQRWLNKGSSKASLSKDSKPKTTID